VSYVRSNGRFSGRVSGRWGGASVQGRYQLGDVAVPTNTVQVAGDPVLALIAQLNRFAGKTFSPEGCGGTAARHYVNTAFPMVPQLTDAAATAAALIVYDRYRCAPIDQSLGETKSKWASAALSGDTTGWAMQNLAEIVPTIAQFGDSLGLPPASYGITTTDKKFAPKLDTTQIILLGGVAFAGILLLTRKGKR
jgi:hypothetical protein